MTRHLVPANRWKRQGRNKLLPVLETQAVFKAAVMGGARSLRAPARANPRRQSAGSSSGTWRSTPAGPPRRHQQFNSAPNGGRRRDASHSVNLAQSQHCSSLPRPRCPRPSQQHQLGDHDWLRHVLHHDAELAARARNPTWLWWSKLFGEELNWRPIQTKLCLGVDDVTIVTKQGVTPTEYEWHAVDLLWTRRTTATAISLSRTQRAVTSSCARASPWQRLARGTSAGSS